MHRALLLILSVFLVSSATGQERCASMSESFKEMAIDSAYARGVFALEQQAEALAAQGSTARDDFPFPTITVPVVVHVLYRTEQQNISNEQIHSQIDVLNRDFAGLNADLSKVPEPFRAIAGFTNIRFQLADRDPEGNFTNGITRTRTTVENIGTEAVYHRPERGGVEPWTQPHYLNVWICELEGNALGFAILPSAQMSERDGIVMSPRAFGTTGTAQIPYNGGRTFVHEVGHYFGLRHLWGMDDASCNSTDHVPDTPIQLKENFGCKNFPSFSCGGEEHGDMFMNYMDYGDDTCMLFFTEQQVALMHLILLNNRKALFHSSGVTGLGEHTLRNPTFSVYPNPAQTHVYAEASSGNLGRVVLVDQQGRSVREVETVDNRLRLDLQGIPAGLYYLKSLEGVKPVSIVD